jgi:cytochrome c oxidase subunit 1
MAESSVQQAHVHAPPEGFIRKYIFSLDHKVIGKQYYGLALVAVFTGMFLSWLMRFHLGWNNASIPGLQLLSKNGAPGGVMTPEYYLQLMTMHATIMVFFVLTTAPFAAFGNYFLPIQVGAEDMPFPHFNMMSFWVTFTGFLVLVASFFLPDAVRRRWEGLRASSTAVTTRSTAKRWAAGVFLNALKILRPRRPSSLP